ncbi:MAG: hypothetical protein R3E96_17125 [Planctomycetota bacterium]
MKWTTPLFLVLILGALGFVARITLFGTPESPQQVLDAVRDRVRLGNYDERRELKAISSALKHPGAREDADLTGDLLRVRADIYRQQERFDKARSDVERIQALTAEEELPLELEAIELQALEGQPEEALRRIEVLAFHHPESADVAQLRGRLETLRGETLRAEALRLAEEQLVDEDTRKATPLIIELCSQHARDPRRTRVQRELRELFPRSRSASLESILDACDLASEHLAQARLAYARGLEQRLTIPALRSLLDLLVEAHRPDLVVDLGVASRVFPEVHDRSGQPGRAGGRHAGTRAEGTHRAHRRVLAMGGVEADASSIGERPGCCTSAAWALWANRQTAAQFLQCGLGRLRFLSRIHRLQGQCLPARPDRHGPLLAQQAAGSCGRSTFDLAARGDRIRLARPRGSGQGIARPQGVISERGEILATKTTCTCGKRTRSSPNAPPALIEENWTKGMSMARAHGELT